MEVYREGVVASARIFNSESLPSRFILFLENESELRCIICI